MIALKNILVATDFSAASDEAVRYSKALAQRYGSALHLLHVVGYAPREMASPFGPALAAGGHWQHQLEVDARQRLENLVTPAERRTLQVNVTVLTAAMPGHAILDYLCNQPIDLAIVGTHGRAGVSHFLLGSVAEYLVRLSPCPVLTMRRPDERRPAAQETTAPSKELVK